MVSRDTEKPTDSVALKRSGGLPIDVRLRGLWSPDQMVEANDVQLNKLQSHLKVSRTSSVDETSRIEDNNQKMVDLPLLLLYDV